MPSAGRKKPRNFANVARDAKRYYRTLPVERQLELMGTLAARLVAMDAVLREQECAIPELLLPPEVIHWAYQGPMKLVGQWLQSTPSDES